MVNTGSCVAVRVWPNPTGSSIVGNQKSHWAISPGHIGRAATPGPAADTPAATPPPVRSTCGSNTATRSVPRSPSPASVGHACSSSRIRGSYPSASDPDRARSYLGGSSRPTPPSPCSANNPSPAQSPRSTPPPTCAAVGSQPNPPRSTPASSLARLRPGSRGSWSIFSCRTVVSIQLPPTRGAVAPRACGSVETGGRDTGLGHWPPRCVPTAAQRGS